VATTLPATFAAERSAPAARRPAGRQRAAAVAICSSPQAVADPRGAPKRARKIFLT